MNSNQKSIDITVKLLKQHKIKKVVISPGGTNIPLVKKLQADPYFTCYSVVDERSAMYFAIGLYLQTGEVIATSCTSAQATRNYIPGLTEAYYKKVPILAITMEKHPRFIGQEYMQAPHQISLPDDCVKKSYELPFVADINDEYHAVRVANEAMLELTHHGKGPVQLCIPWLDFELPESNVTIRDIERNRSLEDFEELKDKKVLIIAGEHRPYTDEEVEAIEHFCRCFNACVYTNHLSNYYGDHAVNGNLLLNSIKLENFKNSLAPDLIITIGGQTGDYPLYLMLSRPELEHTVCWRVTEDGNVVDTYDKLTRVFESSILDFFVSFNSVEEKNSDIYFDLWKNSLRALIRPSDIPFSNTYLAKELTQSIPEDSIIQLSILNSLRTWNLYEFKNKVQCYSNVGAFGIDGGMSTLIGQSMVTDRLCFMVIGDLAFFYDMNSIGIRGIKNNLRILLVNNNGGVEFKLYHGNHEETNKYIAAANHFKNAKGWAETCGFRYIAIHNKEEFSKVKDEFISNSNLPIIIEAFMSDDDDYSGYQMVVNANKTYDASVYIKKGIKKTLNILHRT